MIANNLCDFTDPLVTDHVIRRMRSRNTLFFDRKRHYNGDAQLQTVINTLKDKFSHLDTVCGCDRWQGIF